MTEQIETATIYTHRPYGRDRVILEAGARQLPPEQVTKWVITHTAPLIEHELAAARQITALGLVGVNGAVHRESATLVKGQVYCQLLGKTVVRTEGGGSPETFTPTPDRVNAMPKAVLVEFGQIVEYGAIPTEAEAEEAKN